MFCLQCTVLHDATHSYSHNTSQVRRSTFGTSFQIRRCHHLFHPPSHAPSPSVPSSRCLTLHRSMCQLHPPWRLQSLGQRSGRSGRRSTWGQRLTQRYESWAVARHYSQSQPEWCRCRHTSSHHSAYSLLPCRLLVLMNMFHSFILFADSFLTCIRIISVNLCIWLVCPWKTKQLHHYFWLISCRLYCNHSELFHLLILVNICFSYMLHLVHHVFLLQILTHLYLNRIGHEITILKVLPFDCSVSGNLSSRLLPEF